MNISTKKAIKKQYQDSSKLSARRRLHQRYSNIDWFSWVAERLELKTTDHILDIGCGAGWFWENAEGVPDIAKLVLADISDGMVTEACNRLSDRFDVEGAVTNADQLPFGDASFDTVIAMHMLYHVADPAKAVAEFARVLRPGGCLYVSTNGVRNFSALYALTHDVFGTPNVDPAAAAFGIEQTIECMEQHFRQVNVMRCTDSLECTEKEVVYDYLTSMSPASDADAHKLEKLRAAIDQAFAQGGGAFRLKRETGLISARKD